MKEFFLNFGACMYESSQKAFRVNPKIVSEINLKSLTSAGNNNIAIAILLPYNKYIAILWASSKNIYLLYYGLEVCNILQYMHYIAIQN